MRVFAYFLRVQKVGRPGGETPKAKGPAGTPGKKTGSQGSALGGLGGRSPPFDCFSTLLL